MRLDLPQELPRKTPTDSSNVTVPLDPSPVERHRESLRTKANDRQTLHIAQTRRAHPLPVQEPVRQRTPDRAKDQRQRRETIPQQIVGLSLREEERKVLAEVGRFRVVKTADLAESIYGNRPARMERDLAFLRKKGLLQVDSVNARRDGRAGEVARIEVMTLTRAGRDAARHVSGLPDDQKFYSGIVKPREVEHDTQIYRAYLKEAELIEEKGGTNLRVKLDFELKSEVQKAIHAARKAEPEREMSAIKQQVAKQFELPYLNDGIQIPDARIEYDLAPKDGLDTDQGSRAGHEDIEVITAAYRASSIRAKTQGGFRTYASSSDRASMTAKIEGDHYMMDNILEL